MQKSEFRSEWAESICLRCGETMNGRHVIAQKPTPKESCLSQYPPSAVRKMQKLDDDHQLYLFECNKCKTTICVAVENMIWPLGDGRFWVRFRSKKHYIGPEINESDQKVNYPRRIKVHLESSGNTILNSEDAQEGGKKDHDE